MPVLSVQSFGSSIRNYTVHICASGVRIMSCSIIWYVCMQPAFVCGFAVLWCTLKILCAFQNTQPYNNVYNVYIQIHVHTIKYYAPADPNFISLFVQIHNQNMYTQAVLRPYTRLQMCRVKMCSLREKCNCVRNFCFRSCIQKEG